MLYVNIPTLNEFLTLTEVRSDACVTIYLETSPLRQELDASRIQFSNSIKEAVQQLKDKNFDKRRLALLEDELEAILEDESFWRFHAHSLVVLATPDSIRTYRLANALSNHVEVAERFYLKPLLRALTFPHSAYILALSENEVRLIEFFSDVPPVEVSLPDLPKDAASALGRTLRSNFHGGRLHNDEGKKVRLTQFTYGINEALRPLLISTDHPLILVSTEPLASIYRSTNSLKNLIDETLQTNPEHIGLTDLVKMVRPLLDRHYQKQLKQLKDLFEERAGQRRVTHDLSNAARTATVGGISLLMVDIDAVVPGTIDDEGVITFAEGADAHAYGVVDEIIKRALATGAQVLAVRQDDLPQKGVLSAVLRYPL